MFSYEYINEPRKYRATFYGEWKRLDYCMAATFEEHHNLDPKTNALEHKIEVHNLYLVSYGTPIANITYMIDNTDKRIITPTISVNENDWNCSRSTINQLARWLRELSYSHGVSIPYSELKEGMEMIRHFGCRNDESVIPIGMDFQLVPTYYYKMVCLFRKKCPDWYVERC